MLSQDVTFTIRFVDSCPDVLAALFAPSPNLQYLTVRADTTIGQYPFAGFNHGHCVGRVDVNPEKPVMWHKKPAPNGGLSTDIAPTALFNCGGPNAPIEDVTKKHNALVNVNDADVPNLAFAAGLTSSSGYPDGATFPVHPFLSGLPQGYPFFFEVYPSPGSPGMLCFLLARALPPRLQTPTLTKEYLYYSPIPGFNRNIGSTLSNAALTTNASARDFVAKKSVQWGVVAVGALPAGPRGTALNNSTQDFLWSAFSNCVMLTYWDQTFIPATPPMVVSVTAGGAYCDTPNGCDADTYGDCCGKPWSYAETNDMPTAGNFSGCVMSLVPFDFFYNADNLQYTAPGIGQSNRMLVGLVLQLGVTETPDMTQCLSVATHDCSEPGVPACALADTNIIGPLMCPAWCQPSLTPPPVNSDSAGMYAPNGCIQCMSQVHRPPNGTCTIDTGPYSKMINQLLSSGPCADVRQTASSWPCYGGAQWCSGLFNAATGPECRHALKFQTPEAVAALASKVCSPTGALRNAYKCACVNAQASSFQWPAAQGGIDMSYPEFAAALTDAQLQSAGDFACWWPACTTSYSTQAWPVWRFSSSHCPNGEASTCISRISHDGRPLTSAEVASSASACSKKYWRCGPTGPVSHSELPGATTSSQALCYSCATTTGACSYVAGGDGTDPALQTKTGCAATCKRTYWHCGANPAAAYSDNSPPGASSVNSLLCYSCLQGHCTFNANASGADPTMSTETGCPSTCEEYWHCGPTPDTPVRNTSPPGAPLPSKLACYTCSPDTGCTFVPNSPGDAAGMLSSSACQSTCAIQKYWHCGATPGSPISDNTFPGAASSSSVKCYQCFQANGTCSFQPYSDGVSLQTQQDCAGACAPVYWHCGATSTSPPISDNHSPGAATSDAVRCYRCSPATGRATCTFVGGNGLEGDYVSSNCNGSCAAPRPAPPPAPVTEKKKAKTWVLPVVIVCAVVAVACILGGVLYAFRSKLHLQKQETKQAPQSAAGAGFSGATPAVGARGGVSRGPSGKFMSTRALAAGV